MAHRYGWKKDDPRRLACFRLIDLLGVHGGLWGRLGSQLFLPINLRSGFPLPPFDQGNLGSCTANAIDGLRTFDLAKSQPAGVVAPGSRLFQYWNEREIEGSTSDDSGATITDSVTAWGLRGICLETEWPYVEANFAVVPPAECFEDAVSDKALVSARVAQNLESLYACLQAGFPVIFGISVYESFESDTAAATGTIPAPKVATEALLGGHAIVLCGIDVEKNLAYFRNSWGITWGDGGYGTLPLKEYLLNPDLASDFWVVKQVGAGDANVEFVRRAA